MNQHLKAVNLSLVNADVLALKKYVGAFVVSVTLINIVISIVRP